MYSKDLRECAIAFLGTHTYAETARVFGVGTTTLRSWEELRDQKGSLERRPHNKAITRFPTAELLEFARLNPFADITAIADHFGGSRGGACEALKRAGISQKKRLADIRNGTKSREPNSTLNSQKSPPKRR